MRRRTLVVTAILVAVIVVTAAAFYLLFLRDQTHPGGPAVGVPPSKAAICPAMPNPAISGDWDTYHQNDARTGALAQDLGPVGSLGSAWSGGPTAVDGQVYAEPLVCGSAVYVATENDTVYALNASTGAVIWTQHLGTPVAGASLPCGDINPSGITGTPVIDPLTGVLYAVAFLASGPQHVLFGLNVSTGAVVSRVPVDPAGAVVTAEQQRGALALANGYVYVPYGGLAGDCAQYHGWVVGASLNGSSDLIAYQVPTQREGGIWAPMGISVAPDGDLYVATGNGASTTTFDHGDSVIELSPTLTELGYFAPTNWVQLNNDDTDLGSVAPTLLPDGAVFQIGKEGVGYLLNGTDLGGVGNGTANTLVCAGAYGGTARVGMSVYVACTNGVFNVTAGRANLTVSWHTASFDAGPPIVTGDTLWAVDLSAATLATFNLTTGAPGPTFPLDAVDHFITPSAGPNAVFVAAGSAVFAVGR